MFPTENKRNLILENAEMKLQRGTVRMKSDGKSGNELATRYGGKSGNLRFLMLIAIMITDFL